MSRRVLGSITALCSVFAASLVPLHGQTASTPNVLAPVTKLVLAGDDQGALTAIAALRSSGVQPPGLDRLEGDALFDLGRLPEADVAYERALKADPQDAEAAQMRGLTLFKSGRIAQAIPLLESQHGFGAQSKADPLYVLALCYLDSKRYDDARRTFAAQFGLGAESAPGYLLAARMLLRREYLPVAQQFAEKALLLEPTLPLAHELLGEIALASGHMEEATHQLEAERKSNPLEGITYARLGDAYARAARYPEAEQTLQQAVLLEPHATGPYILLGKVLLKEGRPVGAMTFLQKAEGMDPANYMTHNLLAQTYRSLGRAADASKELALTEKLQAADEPRLASPK